MAQQSEEYTIISDNTLSETRNTEEGDTPIRTVRLKNLEMVVDQDQGR